MNIFSTFYRTVTFFAKSTLAILLMLTTSWKLGAQSNANYTFATNATASLTDMSSGTTELSLAGAALPNTVYHDDDATPVTLFYLS